MRLYRQAMLGRPVSPHVKMTRDGNPVFKYDVANDCVTLDEASRETFVHDGKNWVTESLWNDVNGWEIRPPRSQRHRKSSTPAPREVELTHALFKKREKVDNFALRAKKLGISY